MARVLLAGGGTGGHLVPAMNLAAALRRARPDVELLLVGARRGVEARVLPGSGLPYRLLPLHPIYRSRIWRNWRLAAGAPAVLRGLREAFGELDPELVVGTGGYASGPAVAWGRLGGRRTALQEQNAAPGLVTRILSRWVDQVHLGVPEAEQRLSFGPRTEVFAFGNPVAADATADAGIPTFDWPDGRILLVVGGSQGARSLNERLLADLERAAAGDGGEGPGAGPRRDASPAWPEATWLVWVAGPDHAEAVRVRAGRLPWADRIRVVPFIERLGAQLSRVTLALCRAGAMFVSELAAAGVPAVFVPLPTAAGGHQSANARAAAGAGAAVVREEADLAPGELWETAVGILADPGWLGRMAEAARARGRPDAADRIAAELLRLAERRGGGRE